METVLLAVVIALMAFIVLAAVGGLYWYSNRKKQNILDGQVKLIELLTEYNRESKHVTAMRDQIGKSLVELAKIPNMVQALSIQVMVFNATVKKLVTSLLRPERADDTLKYTTDEERSAYVEITKIMLEKGLSYEDAQKEFESRQVNSTSMSPDAFTSE